MQQRNRKSFQVRPTIPEKLKPLVDISKNFWWVWNFDAIELFQSIDIDIWSRVSSNPIRMLAELEPEKLEELANDDAFLMKMQAVYIDMQDYLTRKVWFQKKYPEAKDHLIAYFSAEFGIHESLPNYSGGLGILAGDHMKSASDTGLPLVGVGLYYHKGYFQQYLNEDGWQQEDYPALDQYSLAVHSVKDAKGEEIKVDVDFPGRKVYARVMQVDVGRVRIFLLDSDIPENSQADREITDILYGGDTEHRIQQELLLGVGGIRALKKMGLFPTVVHMNEGHSAFSALERIRSFIMEDDLLYEEARELVKASTVFTTHTPVPAGNEVFPDTLVSRYLEPYIQAFKVPLDDFLDLGRIHQHEASEYFGMTVFSLRMAVFSNGVSRLHGKVAREMWHEVWEVLEPREVPIDHVTNGIHLPSWVSDEMERLYRRYVGPDWMQKGDQLDYWEKIERIPDSELWKARDRLRERLVGYVRRTVRAHMIKMSASPQKIREADNVLDTEALTIGFSRRFATYKRAQLLFRDRDRLKKLLTNKTRPIQFVFAGKAHPRDMEGKKLIKEIVHFAKDEEIKNKIVFLENYDIRMARYLVQGVDVWLNNPRRPHEASGTSGMKVSPNGGLNLSVLDGWWAEAFVPGLGWSIGGGEEYADLDYQDYVESLALYSILEDDVLPTFYNRGADGIPRHWTAMIKKAMHNLVPVYHTDRMVKEYTEKFYFNSGETYLSLVKDRFKGLHEFVTWRRKVEQKWKGVKVLEFSHTQEKEHFLNVTARISLNELTENDVSVCLVFSRDGLLGEFETERVIPMEFDREENGVFVYAATANVKKAGGYNYTLRVNPKHSAMLRPLEPGFIRWA